MTADGTVCALIGQVASAGVQASYLAYLKHGPQELFELVDYANPRYGRLAVLLVGDSVDVFTRQDIWIPSGPPKPFEPPIVPARDSLLHITPPNHLTFNLGEGKFPGTVELKVGGAQSVTAADLVAVDGASLPRPVSAQVVSKSSTGFDVKFAGWALCRFLPAGASNATLTLRITGADGDCKFGDATIRLENEPDN
jgi:hypothetical protein